MLALVSSEATAAPVAVGAIPAAASANVQVAAGGVDAQAQPLGTRVWNAAARVVQPAVATFTRAIMPIQPARQVTPDVATEAAWLARNGWHLAALVDKFAAGAPMTDEANCIAVAVYHEARGESLEGQMAVARVIMNRAASGKYPTSWCGVVKQPWQFSFVNPRSGYMPSVDQTSASWRKALGVTRLAVANAVQSVPTDCLWYHADYVAPSWGRRLTRVEKIGAHIFYRA